MNNTTKKHNINLPVIGSFSLHVMLAATAPILAITITIYDIVIRVKNPTIVSMKEYNKENGPLWLDIVGYLCTIASAVIFGFISGDKSSFFNNQIMFFAAAITVGIGGLADLWDRRRHIIHNNKTHISGIL